MDLSELDRIGDKIRASFNSKDKARERALHLARETIRNSANAIRSTHRGEFEQAVELMERTAIILGEADKELADHPDIYYAGFLQDAQKEYAEARLTYAFIRREAPPDPDALRVGYAAYLNGLGEALGELRRHVLDKIRQADVSWGEEMLTAMDDLYCLLVSFDYPAAISAGLKRTTDVARSLIERTRGDLTNAMRQQDLEAAMGRLQKRVGEPGADS